LNKIWEELQNVETGANPHITTEVNNEIWKIFSKQNGNLARVLQIITKNINKDLHDNFFQKEYELGEMIQKEKMLLTMYNEETLWEKAKAYKEMSFFSEALNNYLLIQKNIEQEISMQTFKES